MTRGKQWVTVDSGLQLLDTPGILWPKFEDPEVGMMLAYTGAVKEGVIDLEDAGVPPDGAAAQIIILRPCWSDTRWKRRRGRPGWQLLEMAGRKRGYLVSGGEVNTERMAKVLLDEYRSGKLGNFTLEMPEDMVMSDAKNVGN